MTNSVTVFHKGGQKTMKQTSVTTKNLDFKASCTKKQLKPSFLNSFNLLEITW